MDFNYFDIAIIAIISLFALRGLLRGFIKEIFSLVGLVGSIWLAYQYYPIVAPYLTFFENSVIRNVAAYALIFVFSSLLVSIFIYILQRFLSFSFLPLVDKFLGFCFGLCKGLLICAIIVTLAKGFFENTAMLQDAFTLPYLNMLMEYVRSHIPPELFTVFSNN